MTERRPAGPGDRGRSGASWPRSPRSSSQAPAYLRDRLAEDCTRAGQKIPADVAALPSGLLPWQVQEVTRSTAAPGQLLSHQPSPLARVIDVPNPGYGNTLPLLCLTDEGRDHCAGRWAGLPGRVSPPEVAAPEPRTSQ